MRENEENLKELLGRFVEAGDADQMAHDIAQGERLFVENPAPAPEAATVAKIKLRMSEELTHRRSAASHSRIFRFAAAAAMFAIVASVSVRLLEHGSFQPSGLSVLPRAVWEGEDIMTDDADLATLTAAVDQIQGEMMVLEHGEDGSESYDEMLELESELLAMEVDFWKG